MGFVKGMIAGVLGVAGLVITAAVIDVVKDEKKHKAEIKQKKQQYDEELASDEINSKEAENDFSDQVGKVFAGLKAMKKESDL